MGLNGVIRPGLIQLRVMDLDATLTHYKDYLGLDEVCRTDDGRVCLKCYDEFEHHSVVLKLDDKAGYDFSAFKVESEVFLDQLEKKIRAFGYETYHIPANSDQPGFGRRVGCKLCTGHKIEFYAEVESAKERPEITNPDIWVTPPRGMRCQRFDHMLLFGPGIEEAERFCVEVLGLFVPEVCNTPDGKRLASWITGSNKPHDLAFVEYDVPNTLHHVGFLLEDWNDIGNAADWMARYQIKHDVGPTRHAITRGQTIYMWDPSGIRNEVYAGGYTAYPDHPQRVWDQGMLGKGLFYYEGELVPSFLTVVT